MLVDGSDYKVAVAIGIGEAEHSSCCIATVLPMGIHRRGAGRKHKWRLASRCRWVCELAAWSQWSARMRTLVGTTARARARMHLAHPYVARFACALCPPNLAVLDSLASSCPLLS